MSETSQERFTKELLDKVEYFRMEYKLTYIEAFGSFEIVKGQLMQEFLEELEEGE